MRSELNNTKLKFYIDDVRKYDCIHQALKSVNYAFHVVWLKQHVSWYIGLWYETMESIIMG